jgi:hypothetical protein
MQQTKARNTIDIDLRRGIVQAARARRKEDMLRQSWPDFVGGMVLKAYGLKRHQVVGTPLGQEIDRMGELLRRELLAASLKKANAA